MSTYVITGASRGIGLELVTQVLAQKHKVIAGVRNPAAAKELAELAKTHEGSLRVLRLDVKSASSVAEFKQAIGDETVDFLINNAGVLSDQDDVSAEIDPNVVADTFDTNTLGPIRVTQALLPNLRKAANPVIGHVSSQMGSIADNGSGGHVAYRISKTALNMFAKTLALDEPKIVTLTLHPGWVKTRMGGSGATLDTRSSAQGLLNLINSAKKPMSGRFFNYSGKELPW